MSDVRIREAGDAALVVELDERIDPTVNDRVLAVAAAVRSADVTGVRDVVPTFRSVAVFFDPLGADRQRLRAVIDAALAVRVQPVSGRRIEIPVSYGGEDGPDLPEVAAWGRLSSEEVVERHAGRDYRVFMLGFLPGFAYLGSVDERIAMPRRASPRVRVPRGAVGIAGRQTGVYPRESPGGWQIIGRTSMRMFDADRYPASPLRAGDSVRFVRAGRDEAEPDVAASRGVPSRPPETLHRSVTITQPGLMTTVQDEGRWGHHASGVPVSGALDRLSHRVANAAVGNAPDEATLEVTIVGPELRLEDDAVVAIAGADLQPTIDGVDVKLGVATSCRAGSTVRFGQRRSGARAYVAFDGGVDVPSVLGSRATHVTAGLGGMGGRRLVAGDRLPLGPRRQAGGAIRAAAVNRFRPGGARVRILAGPQADYCPPDALAQLAATRFEVTPRSDRMGFRLSGGVIPRFAGREMISDVAFTGGIQIPPSGEPILLMHDHQTTGGYPQIALVITADLPLVGQLAPGDWVEFVPCALAEALAVLAEQETTRGLV